MEGVLQQLREIPIPLAAKAKAMGIQPSIHNTDFVFEFVAKRWSGNFERALHSYYELGKYSSSLARAWVDDYAKSLQTIQERNKSSESPWRPINILDFASGYGCVARHLPLHFPESNVQTCDIHQEAVNFNAEVLNLKSYLSSANSSDLTFPKQDVIIALSFFSHLPKRTFTRWLTDLSSRLSSRGIFIFTANGHVTHTSVVKDIKVDKEGFGFLPKSEQQDLDASDYGLTISYPAYVLRQMKKQTDMRLVRFQEGLWWGTQDTYMFAKS